jgi:CTP synthase
MFIHITLLPYIKAAGELKTKPTQQSVAKLREIGIQPQILVCRTEHAMEPGMREKISLFCNVPQDAVIEEQDVAYTIYEVPLMLKREGRGRSGRPEPAARCAPADMKEWKVMVNRIIAPKRHVNIAVVGKYIEHQDAYKSIYEALTHAGAAEDAGVRVMRLDAEQLEKESAEKFLDRDRRRPDPGVDSGPGGSRVKILSARNLPANPGTPYLGLCLGMQIAVIEFARHVCNLAGAHSMEFDEDTPHPVISLLDEQQKVTTKGGTMRLGDCGCKLTPGQQVARSVRHREHRGAPPAPVRIQWRLPGSHGESRPSRGRRFRRAGSGGNRRSEGPPLVCGLPVPPGVPVQARASRTRSS